MTAAEAMDLGSALKSFCESEKADHQLVIAFVGKMILWCVANNLACAQTMAGFAIWGEPTSRS